MLITSKHLEGACQDQIDLFNKTFPVGAEFNKTNWDLTLRVGLQVGWMVKFLDAPVKETYEKAEKSASKTYFKAETSAWQIYKEVTAPAFEIYYKATAPVFNTYEAPARKIYEKAKESAWKIYDEATAPARKIYNETVKTALFTALDQQFNGIK